MSSEKLIVIDETVSNFTKHLCRIKNKLCSLWGLTLLIFLAFVPILIFSSYTIDWQPIRKRGTVGLSGLRTRHKFLVTSETTPFTKDLRNETDLVQPSETCETSVDCWKVGENSTQQVNSNPSVKLSKGRENVTLILGIPTVKRENASYLIETLDSLTNNMNEAERSDTLIIVFVGETEDELVSFIANQIELQFADYFNSGLIEVIAPSASYYPNLEEIEINLNDPIDRVKWRSKQNLDYAFLMMYAQPKAKFYMQLEDDIVTQPGFITDIHGYIKSNEESNWFILDFSTLGFIGKLFRTSDLPDLISYLQVFYNDKPCDWLLPDFLSVRHCDQAKMICVGGMKKIILQRTPSLFQHMGTFSSLKGKIQLLKDRSFQLKSKS